MAAHQTHYLKVVGSSPTPAILARREPQRDNQTCRLSWLGMQGSSKGRAKEHCEMKEHCEIRVQPLSPCSSFFYIMYILIITSSVAE